MELSDAPKKSPVIGDRSRDPPTSSHYATPGSTYVGSDKNK